MKSPTIEAWVTRCDIAFTKVEKPYASLSLLLQGGFKAEGRIWDWKGDREPLDGSFVLSGRWQTYQGQRQLIVTDWVPFEGDPGLFLPVAAPASVPWEKVLTDTLLSLPEPLTSFVNRVIHRVGWSRFLSAPAATGAHGACLNGLVAHTLRVHDIVLHASEGYACIDTDLALAGALLHDVGKALEYAIKPGFPKTDEARLRGGHVVIGAEQVRSAAMTDRLKTIGNDVRDALEHIVLSHHGKLEWGSPVVPSTPEAVLIHYADLMDAKLSGMQEAVDALDGKGGWTEKIFVLDGARMFVPGEKK